MPSGSASTASARPPTWSPRSPSTRAAGCSPSPATATPRARSSRGGSASEWAGDSTRTAAGAARRGDHLRPGRRARPRRPARRRARVAASSAPASTCPRSPAFPYEILWEERQIRSVANLTRADGDELLPLAAAAGVEAEITTYPLVDANEALDDLRSGKPRGLRGADDRLNSPRRSIARSRRPPAGRVSRRPAPRVARCRSTRSLRRPRARASAPPVPASPGSSTGVAATIPWAAWRIATEAGACGSSITSGVPASACSRSCLLQRHLADQRARRARRRAARRRPRRRS